MDIYFSDLTYEAQIRFLNAMHISNPEEGNFDFFPIATVYGDNLWYCNDHDDDCEDDDEDGQLYFD